MSTFGLNLPLNIADRVIERVSNGAEKMADYLKSDPASGEDAELRRYQDHLQKSFHTDHTSVTRNPLLHEIKDAPLISYSVKALYDKTAAFSAEDLTEAGPSSQGVALPHAAVFPDYALLGQCLPEKTDGETLRTTNQSSIKSSEVSLVDLVNKLDMKDSGEDQGDPSSAIDPVLLNINAPWSAFLCGLQGSGKSYTLSCMLEGCLLSDNPINRIAKPLAGLVFHYDPNLTICEAAKLASIGIKVRVLVPSTSLHERTEKYEKALSSCEHLSVQPFFLQDTHLDVARMKRLMAFSDKDGVMPLYMEVSPA